MIRLTVVDGDRVRTSIEKMCPFMGESRGTGKLKNRRCNVTQAHPDICVGLSHK